MELLTSSLTIHVTLGFFRVSILWGAAVETHFHWSQTWRHPTSTERMKPSFLESYCCHQELPKSLACVVPPDQHQQPFLDMLWEQQRSLHLSLCMGFSMHDKIPFAYESTKHVGIMKLERWLSLFRHSLSITNQWHIWNLGFFNP